MPMMRRGPLDRYPAEWVLRQASAHQANGSIEFHTDRPATFFLDGGRVYAAVEATGVDAANAAADASRHDEVEARQHAVELLAAATGTAAGWYYHDPLGHHSARGSWSWDAATLLMESRSRSHESVALTNWSDRRIRLHDVSSTSITLDTDAWSVVVALAGSADAAELRNRLGWSPSRLAAALTQIDQRGALDPDIPARWSAEPAEPEPAPAPGAVLPPPPMAQAVGAPVEQGATGRHTGPLTPPPSWTPQPIGSTPARSRLRGLRTNRKP